MIFKDILTREQCNDISGVMLHLYENEKEKLNFESSEEYEYYNGSYGMGDLEEVQNVAGLIQSKILQEYKGYVFQSSYTRIYRNGSILKIHTDREKLDLTLTVCVYSDIAKPWPICVSNIRRETDWAFDKPDSYYKQDSVSYETPVGTGVTCLGREYPHWREKLECEENQKVIQTFFHWRKY